MLNIMVLKNWSVKINSLLYKW